MRFERKNFIVFLYIALLASGAAMLSAADPQDDTAAKNEDKVTRMPEVKVQAVANPSLTVPSINVARQRINRVPGGVSVVDANDYKKGTSSTIKDTLGFTPGVYAQPRFGSDEARLSIRGSGIQRTFHLRGIKLLQDGIPINEADGAVDFQSIEPLAQRYIEVFRGSNALEYGSTTLGGAVNFVSPTGYDAPLTQARFEGGSFGYIKTQLSSGYVMGPADYYVSLTETKQHGFRGHAFQENKKMFSNTGIKIGDHAETRFYVSLVQSKSQLPGSLTKAQMDTRPEQAATANITQNQKRDFDYIRLANKTTIEGNDQRLEGSIWWFYKDLFHPIFQLLDIESDNLGGLIKYVNYKDVFGHKNIFIFGFNPAFGFVRDTRYANTNGEAGAQTADSRQKSYNFDFFTEEQFYLFSKFALVGGLQWSIASRKVKDYFLSNGDNGGHPVYHGLSPKAGVRYEFTERSQVFANVSRSFEPPSFGELTNVTAGGILGLIAQKGTTMEIGTRGHEGRFEWDFAYYFSWIDNELLSLNDGSGNPLGTVNAYRTHHQGIEFGTNIDVFDGILVRPDKENTNELDKFLIRVLYNWSDFHFVNDPAFSDNPLPGIPAHFLKMEWVYEHPIGIYFGPNIEAVFHQFPVDMNNTLFARPYIIFGLKGGYRMKKGVSVFVEAKNLANKTYAATTGVLNDARSLDSAQFFPGDGASVTGGIEWKW